MTKATSIIFVVTFMIGFSAISSRAALDEELVIKNCQELMRLAQNYNEDMQTFNTILGVAIDSGSMDRVRNYKLKKSEVKQKLESVMKALEIKGCVKPK